MKKSTTISIICVALGVFGFFYLHNYNKLAKTRFVMQALGRYLNAYELVEGQPIQSLADIPDFDLISYPYGFELKSEDLKKRIISGYFYDFKRGEGRQFVVSASPLKINPFSQEFGMIEDGNLRVNVSQVDPQPDSHDEVQEWPILAIEWFEIKTKPESS